MTDFHAIHPDDVSDFHALLRDYRQGKLTHLASPPKPATVAPDAQTRVAILLEPLEPGGHAHAQQLIQSDYAEVVDLFAPETDTQQIPLYVNGLFADTLSRDATAETLGRLLAGTPIADKIIAVQFGGTLNRWKILCQAPITLTTDAPQVLLSRSRWIDGGEECIVHSATSGESLSIGSQVVLTRNPALGWVVTTHDTRLPAPSETNPDQPPWEPCDPQLITAGSDLASVCAGRCPEYFIAEHPLRTNETLECHHDAGNAFESDWFQQGEWFYRLELGEDGRGPWGKLLLKRQADNYYGATPETIQTYICQLFDCLAANRFIRICHKGIPQEDYADHEFRRCILVTPVPGCGEVPTPSPYCLEGTTPFCYQVAITQFADDFAEFNGTYTLAQRTDAAQPYETKVLNQDGDWIGTLSFNGGSGQVQRGDKSGTGKFTWYTRVILTLTDTTGTTLCQWSGYVRNSVGSSYASQPTWRPRDCTAVVSLPLEGEHSFDEGKNFPNYPGKSRWPTGAFLRIAPNI